MNELFDIILEAPISDTALRLLLFFTFFLHLLFVLLMIGTALLALTSYVKQRWGSETTLGEWDKPLLGAFFTHKSLAIVLGIAPILLMQVGHTIPFMTASALVAPLWMLIIIFLLASFALLEYVAQRGESWRFRHLIASAAGVAFLLMVPATFVTVLVGTENPAAWKSIFALGRRLPAALSIHWLARYLHVLGAAAIFAAAFQLSIDRQHPGRCRFLINWIFAFLILQILGGIALFASIPRTPQALVVVLVLISAAAALLLLWLLFKRVAQGTLLNMRATSLLLLVLLSTMLLTRQMIQDRVLVPFQRQVAANAADVNAQLSAARAESAIGPYITFGMPYDRPEVIWARSCLFCHGTVGNGQGDAAPLLRIPPEDLSALRMSPQTTQRILREGVSGSAMPTFGIYTSQQLRDLIGFLQREIGIKAEVEPLSLSVSPEAQRDATSIFAHQCARCHGADGAGTELALRLRPPPPDLRNLALAPRRAFAVISDGYSGTMMPSFASLPEETRWGLVMLTQKIYHQN